MLIIFIGFIVISCYYEHPQFPPQGHPSVSSSIKHPSQAHSQKHSKGSQEHAPDSTQEHSPTWSSITIIRSPTLSCQGL